MDINCLQTIIRKLNKILSLFHLLFPLIICELLPEEIRNNRFQINHLLNGQTFRKNKLICTYDSQYSIKININYNNNLKYFLCLIISSPAYLYIINSDDDDILCKYNILQNLPVNNINTNYISLIPYLNNSDFNCIIAYIETSKSLILNIYQLKDFNETIIEIKKFSKSINSKYPIGSGVFDNSANLIFSFSDNETITIYKYNIETGNLTGSFEDKCKNCFDLDNINNIESSLIINNNNYREIFPCYKNNEKMLFAICYIIIIHFNIIILYQNV